MSMELEEINGFAPAAETNGAVVHVRDLESKLTADAAAAPVEEKPVLQNGEAAEEEDESKNCCFSLRCKAYRNVFGTGISFMMSLSSVVSLFSLQSSLDADLGLYALTVFMVFFLISGIFASTIIHILGTKFTLVLSYTLLGVYTVANFYSQTYTLIPAAVFGGTGFGPVFAASNVHVTTIAIRFAGVLKERPEYLVSLFAGIQAMFFKVAYIPGSFATFTVLFIRRAASNESKILDYSENLTCNNMEASELKENPDFIYILLSVLVLFDVGAIIICLFTLDRLQEDVFGCHIPLWKIWKVYVKKPILATLKMFTNWKMYMIIPMMILDGYLASFALGTFYKVSLHTLFC